MAGEGKEQCDETRETGKKLVPGVGMPGRETLAMFKYFVETDFEDDYMTEEDAAFWPGGVEAVNDFNKSMRDFVDLFREHSAACLKEYEAKGYLETTPPKATPPTGK